MKRVSLLLILVAAGCSRGTNTAALISRSDTLIAANKFPSIPSQDELTDADRKRLDRHYPNTLKKLDNRKPLSLQDIKNMTRSGVADNAIIAQITATRSIFYLTPSDEVELEQAGVSFAVIEAMKRTSEIDY